MNPLHRKLKTRDFSNYYFRHEFMLLEHIDTNFRNETSKINRIGPFVGKLSAPQISYNSTRATII